MNNTLIIDITKRLKMAKNYQWLLLCWEALTHEEKSEIASIALLIMQKCNHHRIGLLGALELVAKLGIFLALDGRVDDEHYCYRR